MFLLEIEFAVLSILNGIWESMAAIFRQYSGYVAACFSTVVVIVCLPSAKFFINGLKLRMTIIDKKGDE